MQTNFGDTTPVLVRDRIRTPEGKSVYVRALFARIADRYDFITVALSYGQDRRWKERLVAYASDLGGAHALDLATGTGDLAFALAERGARVVGLDITPRMIELARAKSNGAGRLRAEGASASAVGSQPDDTRFLVGDMCALPFANQVFDVVTTGYGLRNVPDLALAIAEIHRVLKPGGQLLSLDFNRPANAVVRAVYLTYLTAVGAALGWLLHRDPDTYRYIPASIRQYPGAEAVVRMMRDCGFGRARYYRVLGGLMAIHHAIRT
jgi:demethylmenaquinone methyltransferase / 2-methoxy-6-polyprenyl-1,4-benzoquinol methylase